MMRNRNLLLINRFSIRRRRGRKMRSTFMGLETAKRGMYAQQSAIYVTGHNIANANTPGYTRQRVNFKPSEPFPGASMNRPQIPGQLGTGVEDDSIQRIREKFI